MEKTNTFKEYVQDVRDELGLRDGESLLRAIRDVKSKATAAESMWDALRGYLNEARDESTWSPSVHAAIEGAIAKMAELEGAK